MELLLQLLHLLVILALSLFLFLGLLVDTTLLFRCAVKLVHCPKGVLGRMLATCSHEALAPRSRDQATRTREIYITCQRELIGIRQVDAGADDLDDLTNRLAIIN